MKISNSNDVYKYTPDEIYDYIYELERKLDKAIELLIASEYKQFLINEKGKETIKECWLRYIEQELEK